MILTSTLIKMIALVISNDNEHQLRSIIDLMKNLINEICPTV